MICSIKGNLETEIRDDLFPYLMYSIYESVSKWSNSYWSSQTSRRDGTFCLWL